jgi:uncharacterized protein YqjF (DUF2071 family)
MRTEHRPWPIPSRPWRMKQVWQNLLFAHWPIEINLIKPFIPPSLEIDTYNGKAWIGVVPFYMNGIRLRNAPPIPLTSSCSEINVRTYVTINNKPGVLFLSLDAANLIAVKVARLFYHLPYYYADISIKKEKNVVHYNSNRVKSDKTFEFSAKYMPTSHKFNAKEGTLEYWLTERYCLYTSHKNRLYRCDILHEPWDLQHADGEIIRNTMIDIDGLDVSNVKPLMHYSERIEVLTWGLSLLNDK